MKFKSRTIPFSEYFDNLQKEYIVAELRFKIYPREKDKEYYRDREMKGKRKTIEDISLRNNLPTIFNSVEKRKRFYQEIYNKKGLPNFIYRSDEDRKKRHPLDIINFFYRGTDVTVITEQGVLPGKIVYTNISTGSVSIDLLHGEVYEYPFDKIIRELK